MLRIAHCLDNRLIDGGKVVNPELCTVTKLVLCKITPSKFMEHIFMAGHIRFSNKALFESYVQLTPFWHFMTWFMENNLYFKIL
jgi:hypothetical protein